MPPARRKVTVTAPPAAWKQLGELLEDRRKDLGHTYRVPFDKVSGVNQRMQAEIEKAGKDRINHFTDGSLRKIARGYQVTCASMLAVLRGEADQLTPAAPAAVRSLPAPAVTPGDPPGWPPGRTAANRPYHDRLTERRVELATRGITYPSGAQMFGADTEASRAWDEDFAHLPVGDRVWAAADVQRRRDAARQARPQANDRGA